MGQAGTDGSGDPAPTHQTAAPGDIGRSSGRARVLQVV